MTIYDIGVAFAQRYPYPHGANPTHTVQSRSAIERAGRINHIGRFGPANYQAHVIKDTDIIFKFYTSALHVTLEVLSRPHNKNLLKPKGALNIAIDGGLEKFDFAAMDQTIGLNIHKAAKAAEKRKLKALNIDNPDLYDVIGMVLTERDIKFHRGSYTVRGTGPNEKRKYYRITNQLLVYYIVVCGTRYAIALGDTADHSTKWRARDILDPKSDFVALLEFIDRMDHCIAALNNDFERFDQRDGIVNTGSGWYYRWEQE